MKRLGRGSEECRGLYAEYRRGWKFSSRVRVTGCMASCCCTNAIRCKAPTALAGSGRSQTTAHPSLQTRLGDRFGMMTVGMRLKSSASYGAISRGTCWSMVGAEPLSVAQWKTIDDRFKGRA